jgi:NADPH-dependent curcumin reductase CurA
MAKQAGLHIVASAGTADLDYVRGLGADAVVDYKKERFEQPSAVLKVSQFVRFDD